MANPKAPENEQEKRKEEEKEVTRVSAMDWEMAYQLCPVWSRFWSAATEGKGKLPINMVCLDGQLHWMEKLCVPHAMQSLLIEGCHFARQQSTFEQLWHDLDTHCVFANPEAAKTHAWRVIAQSWS